MWLALIVVDEAAEQAERGQQVARSTGLRLALAYLCSIADGPIGSLPNRRSIFDTFWREVTGEHGGNPHSATYYRASMAVTCLQQIGRQLGQPALFFNLVREARLPERRAAEVRRCGSRGWGRA